MQRLINRVIVLLVLFYSQSWAIDKSVRKDIEENINNFREEVIEIRRHLHSYPELSNREYKTSEYIASILNKYGIPHNKGIANTGIVALLKGIKPGAVVAYRADMDALP